MAPAEKASVHLDAFEDATGMTITDRDGFMTALKGLIGCCSGDDVEEGDEPEEDEPRKGPSIAVVLGGLKPKK